MRDARYVKMRQLASKAYQPLPFNDVDGTCGRDRCICGNCWIREMVDRGVYREQLKAKLDAGKAETAAQ